MVQRFFVLIEKKKKKFLICSFLFYLTFLNVDIVRTILLLLGIEIYINFLRHYEILKFCLQFRCFDQFWTENYLNQIFKIN